MSVRYAYLARPAALRLAVASRLLIALLLAAGAAGLAGSAHAQAAYQPEFDLDVVGTRTDAGVPQIDVYTAIPYSNLRFLSRPGGFEARYTVSVEVHRLDDEGQRQGLVTTRSWEREVAVPTYEETQAHATIDRATQSLEVEPGRYAVEVQLEDAASRRSFVREAGVQVDAYTHGIALSDPLVLDRYDAGGRLFPNVGGVVRTDQEAFTVYYEVYAQQAADLRVTYVATEEGRYRERPSFRALLGLSEREQTDLGTPLVLSEPLSVRAGRNPATLRIETDRLRVGDYVLSIRIEAADGRLLAETNKPLSVRWMGLEGQISDIEEAISQLRYVARDSEIQAMRNAATPEEKVRLFQAFWDRRDPSPGTRRNERMEEYYYRVAYANEQYGRMRDAGWNTDRGEVFIRFGEPDMVERHPFNYGTKPYEIWYYNRHGRRFIFVDETGMGDYRLLIPVWDDRTRM
ncbi:MAG TPA: GWxTD domain-containing protein [Rubricoccaceae bacterium]|nr:GWxTD domain-containing protein [Rubricoccaceae bacterium]